MLLWNDLWGTNPHGEVALDELEAVVTGTAAPKFQRHLLADQKILGRRGQVWTWDSARGGSE